ncbi:hypothetical protein [Streptomyces zagrosensis]|uniref:Uncharacterized protein n=1 Tax=Streptomyces zagrosensis TaxID=1042984 RepID=A0A7W9V3M8_9ACTN|nr:hypothetical protein [Streptomyces zagrosensis]MBB5940079.1 hypothetical protein [Streptomyces zagrosensis]
MDLLDWHRGRLTSRRLAVLVKHLPRDSATLHEIHGDAAGWSVTDYLLAAAVDHLAESNWMFATVNRDEDSEPLDYPQPTPRPGDESAAAEAPPAETPVAETASQNPSTVQLTRFFS